MTLHKFGCGWFWSLKKYTTHNSLLLIDPKDPDAVAEVSQHERFSWYVVRYYDGSRWQEATCNDVMRALALAKRLARSRHYDDK